MRAVTEPDLTLLRSDIGILGNTILVGILVGAGSLVLHFSDGSSLLIQCPFEAIAGRDATRGHGENPATAPALFRFLNEPVTGVAVSETGESTLRFRTGSMRIIPDHSGLESYVLRTSRGVMPVF